MNQRPQESVFADLLERNHPRWYGIARAYAPDEGRDDLLQEIMLQVWKGLPRFAEHSHIDTWAYRIALNTALAWDRSAKTRRRRLQIETADVTLLQANQGSIEAEKQILDGFLRSLSKIDRAVMLFHLDGITNSEATEIIGLSEGAVRVRLHRLKKRFQETYCEKKVKP